MDVKNPYIKEHLERRVSWLQTYCQVITKQNLPVADKIR